MTTQPDKLFREKLAEFPLKTPEHAWKSIEAGLASASRKRLVMKIAAGITLIAASGIWGWNTYISTPSDPIAISTELPPTPTPPETQPKLTEETSVPTTPIPQKEISTVHQPVVQMTRPGNLSEPFDSEPTLLPQQTIPVPANLIPEPPEEMTISETADFRVADPTSPIYTPVVRRYAAAEINKKYLKLHQESDTLEANRKSPPLQVLADVAYQLKNNAYGIGDLRQMKDELFLLSFIDEKKNKQ